MDNTKLFVGNLDYTVTEEQLTEHFRQVGEVTSVRVIVDKYTGRSRGFGFVEYATAEEAQKAVDEFHGKEFQGRPLVVNIARPREDRPQQKFRQNTNFRRERRNNQY